MSQPPGGPGTAPSTMRVLTGTSVSPGYGEGLAFPYRRTEHLFSAAVRAAPQGKPPVELQRMESARTAARLELQALTRNLKENYDLNQGDIFHAHFLILDDDLLIGLIRDRTAQGHSAEAAVAEAIAEVETMFRGQSDPYLRERAVDVRDVGARILRHLVDRQHHPFAHLRDAAVIVADELYPSDTVFLSRSHVRAIVTERGSENSHAAILSRAFGIPAVTGVAGILDLCGPGDPISVDGESGRVVLHVEGREQADYARRARGYRVAVEEIRELPSRTVTLDGVEVLLQANVDREEDIEVAVAREAAGIGLLRTEMLYLGEGGQVTEGHQEEVFRYVARRMGDRPVNIRILDLAADKVLPLSADAPLPGAAIAESGVHYALAHPDLLRPQLRAILHAADDGNLRILLPGVTGITEIEAFQRFMETVADELRSERGRVSRRIPVGAMIETLPALFMLRDIAESADFLSLGTNDLLRHLFGRERGRVKETVYEPSLVRAIDAAVRLAGEKDRELGICGEVAGEPILTALLVGLGLRRLSMSPERLPEVRYNASCIRADDAAGLAHRILALKTAGEIEHYLREHLDPWHQLVCAREDAAR
jgi:phosphoenolpyruvate-protein phosphotransferase